MPNTIKKPNSCTRPVWSFGALIRQVQTGRVQLYGFFIVFGIVVMLLIKVV
jgi:hypothetical protein